MKTRSAAARGERSARGMALAIVLIMTSVAFLLVAGVLSSSSTSARLSWSSTSLSQATAASDAGLEVAVALIKRDALTLGADGVSDRVESGFYRQQVATILTQRLAGVEGVQVTIASRATTNAGERLYEVVTQTERQDPVPLASRVALDVRLIELPVTAFSYFYDVDLELYPWHDWVVTGPVYCGGTAYFRPTSGARLTFAEKVFAVEGIRHHRHPLEPDPRGPDIIEYESDRLERVPSMVPEAPDGSTNRMHWIIQIPEVSDFGTAVGSQRFYNKADVVLRVRDGAIQVQRGLRHGGAVFSTVLPACARTNVIFYDGRETAVVRVTALDAAGLRAWVTSVLGAATPAHPVIYVSDERTLGAGFFAVRIENGHNLPVGGLTLATPNPLYVKGRFNTANPQPSMLAGDAVTVLSSGWRDGEGDDADPGNDGGDGSLPIGDPGRIAMDTTVNAALVTGIVPADGTYGSGWVANVVRLLEDWSASTLTFNGSMAVLYHSEISRGPFYHGTYYRAPAQRTFAFVNYFEGAGLRDVPTVKMALRAGYRQLPPE
jgi:hypothetical protein